MLRMADNEQARALATEPYRGVRDFYPEDMAVQRHILGTMRQTAQRFGYEEYSASVLEPAELYDAKSGSELAGEQAYRFTDRGGREVMLRPEMTPTLARMVARRKHELSLPVRFFSIPNLFRYERPQRGRLREHWQLNIDLFGVESVEADIEVIHLAYRLMREFGARDDDFQIRINNRALLYALHEELGLDAQTSQALIRLIDRKEKMEADEFTTQLEGLVGSVSDAVKERLEANDFTAYLSLLPENVRDHEAVQRLQTLFDGLEALGVENAVFSPTLVRGLDYYTGTVFEIFDTNPENRRALFGGGRYDDLLGLFGVNNVPAVGFGMGDVTIRDFLELHNLLPAYESMTTLFIATTDPEYIRPAQHLAQTLRAADVHTAVNLSEAKVGDQIKRADKKGIPYVICFGEHEATEREFTVKHLPTGHEKTLSEGELAQYLTSE